MNDFTHLDDAGAARMVDVGDKPETLRRSVAEAFVEVAPDTLAAIADGTTPKGDALAVSRIAGIHAAKRACDVVPLCHPISLTNVTVDLSLEEGPPTGVRITTACETVGRTGVEMEALAAASAASLTLYDMLKAVERGIVIRDIRLLEKHGGASGSWERTS